MIIMRISHGYLVVYLQTMHKSEFSYQGVTDKGTPCQRMKVKSELFCFLTTRQDIRKGVLALVEG